jgi:hypothetical protein
VVTIRTASLHSLILRSARTVYLCVLCGSENKQRLFPYTALTDWFLSAFEKLRKPLCASFICQSAWTTVRIFMKFRTSNFSKICSENSSFVKPDYSNSNLTSSPDELHISLYSSLNEICFRPKLQRKSRCIFYVQ